MKLIPLFVIVFSIIILSSTTYAVYADTCESITSGDWDSGTTWDSGVPAGCDVVINSGHTVTITSFVSQPASITIEWGGELIADGPNGGRITLEDTGDGTNNGLMTMIGANNLASGSFRNQGSFTNACSGFMVFNGGMGTNTGSFRNEGTAVNSGNMDFNGGDGTRSGTLNNDVGSFTNHNTINFIAGGGSQAGESIGVITEDPEPCPKVGGELLPIDTTALLLAGFQTNAIWMLPIVMSAVGIGAFVLTKKK